MKPSPHARSLVVAATLLVATLGCTADEQGLCEPGMCPFGTACDPASGRCEPTGAGPGASPHAAGGYLSAALASTGEVLFAAYDTVGGGLLAGRVSAGEVQITGRIDGSTTSGTVGQWPALALDRDDQPRVAYYDATAKALKLARWDQGGWAVDPTPVDGGQGHDVGRHASMVADNTGGLHVAYRDDTGRALRLVSLGESGCHPPGGAVGQPVVVGAEQMAAAGLPSDDVGTWTSIDITPDGRLAVSFYDAGRGNLMLATCTGGELELTLIDGEDPAAGADTGDVGQWSSLAVDRKGKKIGVAYFDRTRGALKFASSRQGTLEAVVVDDGAPTDGLPRQRLVGQAAALDYYLGSDALEGLPRIAYVDATDRSVRIARRNVYGNWVLTGERAAQVAPDTTAGGVGAGLDLLVGPDDVATVVFGVWGVEAGALSVSVASAACTEATCIPEPAP